MLSASVLRTCADFDGLFRHGLLKHLFERTDAADELQFMVEQMMPTMVGVELSDQLGTTAGQ